MNDDILTKIKTQNETFRDRIDKKNRSNKNIKIKKISLLIVFNYLELNLLP
jgi:hypothetical protein